MGATAGRDFKRGLLAVMTSGTSEIKTGGGINKDETMADTLFPKAINDWALEGRQQSREKAEAKIQAEKDALDAIKPPPAPDITDELLRGGSKNNQTLRSLSNGGRRSTFLTGVASGSTAPGRKTLLSGY